MYSVGVRTLAHRAIAATPLLWLLVAVPAVFAVEHLAPDRYTALFVLAVLAIVPLAALLSRATESVAAKTGDAVGGLLNATLGNLTELVIALLLGGLQHHMQEFNRATARLQAGMLFLACVALLVPSAVGGMDRAGAADTALQLSIGLAVLLLVAYVLGLMFSLRTHKEIFAGAAHAAGEEDEHLWPARLAAVLLVVVTIFVALVSEIFVESVQYAAAAFGMTPAFVGFIVVSIVGAAAEMMAAFTAARKNRLDLSVGIALGSSAPIALFVAPVLVLASLFIAPVPMDLTFWPGAVITVLISTLIVMFVTNSGRSGWYVGVLLLVVYATFALTLYVLPPATG